MKQNIKKSFSFCSTYISRETMNLGANKRFIHIANNVALFRKVSVVIPKDKWEGVFHKEIKLYLIPKTVISNRFLSFIFLNFYSFYSRFKGEIMICDFNPVPLLFYFSSHQFQLIHDLRLFTEFGRWNRLEKSFLKLSWKYIKNWITVSYDSKEKIIDFLGNNHKNIIVSYNGIDKRFYCFEKKKKIYRDIDILYIASYEERKNHKSLLEVLGKIHKPLHVVFIGKGNSFKAELQNVFMKKISHHNIQFLENLDEISLRKIYYRSKLFVSPSLYEGFGMPLIEANASGCYICCSDIPIFKEILQHSRNVTFFNPLITSSILTAILQNLSNRFSQNDGEFEKFDWHYIAKKLVTDIESAIIS